MNRLSLSLTLGLLLCACGNADGPGPVAGDPDSGIVDPVPTALSACVDNGFTTLWDVNNLHGAIGTMALSADGILAVASLDGSLKQWNVGMSAEDAPLANGRPSYGTTFTDEGDRLTAIGFANDAKLLIGGDASGNIQVYSTVDASLVSSTPYSEFAFTAAAVSPDESKVVFADEDFAGNVRVWTRETGALSDPAESYLWGVSAVRYNADGTGYVVAGEWYGIYGIEYYSSDDPLAAADSWITEDTTPSEFFAVAFSADGSHVIAGGTGGVLVFAADDFAAGPVARLDIEGADINSVLVSGDYIVTSGDDGQVRILSHDVEAGTLTQIASEAITLPVGLALDASGERLLSAGGDGRVRALGCAE